MIPSPVPMSTSVCRALLPGGLLERRHAVGDRLDAGDRRAAGGEGVEHAEEPGAVEERVGVELASGGRCPRRTRRRTGRSPLRYSHSAEPEQHEHVGDEEVGGDGEDLPGLLHPAQVPVGDQRDEEQRDRHLVRREDVEGRHQRGGAGRGRHRDREDVVGEQRGAGHLRRDDAEVVAGDEVGTSRRRVRLDRLAVAQDQEPEHHHHRDGDRAPPARRRPARRAGSGRGGSPRWRRPTTRGCRTRTPPARSACRAAGAPSRRSASAGRAACRFRR